MSFRLLKSNRRVFQQTAILFLTLVISLASARCSSLPLPNNTTPVPTNTAIPETPTATPVPEPELPETEINFWADVPADTPASDTIYLSVLDEITGLALHAENYPMELVESSDGSPSRYHLSLALPVQSLVYYRYERQSESARVGEYTSAGLPVHYRLYLVEGPGSVEDFISRWQDTEYTTPSGRIMGQAWDAATGLPIDNLLLAAGGQQTFTASDGSFLFEGLPPGVHNLVAVSMDGEYITFQQGAQVAADSTTPAEFQMPAAQPVEVLFQVRLPKDTPPLVPVRIAGNLSQLGNSFTNLAGGVNGLTSEMPVLHASVDGTYSTTVTLPAGAMIHYKYTLGDGFWNAEPGSNAIFRSRRAILPETGTVITDVVEAWGTGERAPVIFDVQVPDQTPAADQVTIQINPGPGWTEPIPMWRLAANRWAYMLYNPLTLSDSLTYRYCLNQQCDVTNAEGKILSDRSRQVAPGEEIQNIKDQVESWQGFSFNSQPFPATIPVNVRGPGFWAGVELQPAYNPTWKARIPNMIDALNKIGANTLVLAPTWTYTRNSPPVLEILPGQDMLASDLKYAIERGLEHNLTVAIFPTPRFPQSAEAWWQPAVRDFSWWLVWFAHYRTFLLHHADIATQSGAQVLIIGGDWVRPALPGGTLVDGSPSGVPADTESRWRELIQEIRVHFPGAILWALPADAIKSPPHFLDAVDRVYLTWDSPAGGNPAEIEAQAASFFDDTAQFLQIAVERPFVLAVNVQDGPQPLDQVEAYQTLLSVVNQRGWIAGFISRGFYPPMAVQDNSTSVHGKPSEDLISTWFPLWLGGTP